MKEVVGQMTAMRNEQRQADLERDAKIIQALAQQQAEPQVQVVANADVQIDMGQIREAEYDAAYDNRMKAQRKIGV